MSKKIYKYNLYLIKNKNMYCLWYVNNEKYINIDELTKKKHEMKTNVIAHMKFQYSDDFPMMIFQC